MRAGWLVARKPKAVPVPDAWSDTVGQIPHKVTVREEPTRGWRLYLWWRRTGADESSNWGKESLRTTLRDADGYFVPTVAEIQAKATLACSKKYAQLYGGEPVTPATPIAKVGALTIGATFATITDLKKGLYRHPSKYRDEVKRALAYAGTVWGTERTWNSLERSDWLELMNTRIAQLVRDGKHGVGATEHTIIRLITVVRWLKEEEKILEAVPMPKRNWKALLAEEWQALTQSHKPPEISRPRYTIEEYLKILKASWDVDPRFGLLVNLGVGLRLGQVRRGMRSDLKLIPVDESDVYELTVHGQKKKGGAVIELTPGQRALVEKMFATVYKDLEARWQKHGIDYPLFPSGRMRGLETRVQELRPRADRGTPRKRVVPHFSKKQSLDKPVHDMWWIRHWKLAEIAAGVPSIPGKKSYAGKRVVVDGAIDQEITDRGLQALGGWSSVVVPKGTYAERDGRKGRHEARDVKMKILGEAT